MDHLREHYGTEYAPNTRETFRRQVLHQFVQGRIADYNPFDPSLPTNSPNAHYAITDAALDVVRCVTEPEGWDSAVEKFRREQGALVERYERERDYNMVPIKLPDGQKLQFSPGKHNEVQKAIIEEFAPSVRSRRAPALPWRHGQKEPVRRQCWSRQAGHCHY